MEAYSVCFYFVCLPTVNIIALRYMLLRFTGGHPCVTDIYRRAGSFILSLLYSLSVSLCYQTVDLLVAI